MVLITCQTLVMVAPIASPDLASALREGTDREATDSTLLGLLDLQFWLIGRDIEHPDGNLLIRMGFDREPAPDGLPVHSRYRWTSEGMNSVLWAWGLFFQQEGAGLLLTRGGRGAVPLGRAPDIYVPPPAVANSRYPAGIITDICRWLASYEERVTTTVGLGHRVPRPGSSPRLAPPEPWSLASAWHELAELIGRSGGIPRISELAQQASRGTASKAISSPQPGRTS